MGGMQCSDTDAKNLEFDARQPVFSRQHKNMSGCGRGKLRVDYVAHANPHAKRKFIENGTRKH